MIGSEVGDYLDALVEEPLALLRELRDHISDTGEESIYLHPVQARLLEILIRSSDARQILEIGTHLGYSTIWLATACPVGGRVQTIESDPVRFARAREWIERSGLSDRVEQILGDAGEVLPELADEHYDLVFIDANKTGYPDYLTHAARVVRDGGLIVADNTLHRGRVVMSPIERATTQAIDDYNRSSHSDPQLRSVLVPLGDGLTISVKKSG